MRPLPLNRWDDFLFGIASLFPFDIPVFRRFLAGPSASDSDISLLLSPPDLEAAGVGGLLAFNLALSFRNSETTCRSRLLVYACLFRGACVPLPAETSKNSLRLPCLFVAAAYKRMVVSKKKPGQLRTHLGPFADLLNDRQQEVINFRLVPTQLFKKESESFS